MITGVVDTGEQFITGDNEQEQASVINTFFPGVVVPVRNNQKAKNLLPVSTIPLKNCLPVSTTPLKNCLPVSTTPLINFLAASVTPAIRESCQY